MREKECRIAGINIHESWPRAKFSVSAIGIHSGQLLDFFVEVTQHLNCYISGQYTV